VPPKPVSFEVADAAGRVLLAAPPGEPEKRDLNGYAVDSNTFTLRWRPAGDTDIAGYTYNDQPGWADLAQYRASKVPLLAPPPRVVTTSTDIPFRNADNGVYAITVRAIDKAGNISAPSTIALALSHYLPFTVVNDFNSNKDLFGTVRLTILGRGFTANGKVRKIYLDRGERREPPWDIEVDPTAPVTVTDRTISGIVLDANHQSGKYRVVLAQDRPSGTEFYFSNVRYDFESPGTVKIGNFELLLPRWAAGRTPGYSLPVESLLILLVVLLLGTLSVLSIRRMFALAQEGAILRGEVLALISGQTNVAWEERKKRMQALKKKGVGLRLKFTLLMVVLVTMIVLIVSVPLGYQMVGRQRLALASGLRNNASILMDALAASAETQFRLGADGFVSAGDIPSLRTAMAEANFTTITGPDPSLSPLPYPKDFVWASDQKEFAAERSRGTFRIAKESVKDELARSAAPALQKHVDADAANKYASLIEEYRTLKGQAAELRTRTDAASKARVTALTAQLAQKSAELDTQAKADYAGTSTLEPFNPAARLSPTYLFYKPIIYYNRADNVADTSFYQGMVRLEVKTDAITRQINESIGTILKTASAIALAAIALGVLGAIIMASITVTPIRKLAQGVAKIRDTEKKEELKDHVIVVGSRDEIGELADTVNTMTQGLVKAALANNELLAGIDVQKRFLPLVKGAGAVTGSTAEEDRDPRVEVYGYYRGAKGVSGDYFDFKRLDESHYALIKCDIAGKGVSAALIMVEVATIFISFFKEWVTRRETMTQIADQKARQKAMHELDRIDSLVYRINDMLEERGFPGRFAALTICILNTETGVATVCNAGDTILNVYESDQKRMVHNQLPDSPAAGTFASMLVEMKAPYKQVNQKLDHGDVLFLQTDGIEESKRKLRNSAFQEIVCDEPGLAAGEVHLGTHKKGDKEGTEEFGTTRIDGVLNAVFARGTYTLVRNHNPIPNEELTFDFSSCTGTAREAVLALIAVEKVYRQIPDPAAPEASRVLVDTKVADFLEKHFKQHGRYFAHPMKDQSVPGYVTFAHAREDDQYDDLTILVVRRK
jgi:HAMP domain-containing protein